MFLPVLSHFQNDNPWSASAGRASYRIRPTAEEEGRLTVEMWEGPWAYEFSTVEWTETFPLSEEGLTAVREWIEVHQAEINARPRRSMEEDLQRRRAPEG